MEARILQFSLAPEPARHCCATGHLWIQDKPMGYHGTGSCQSTYVLSRFSHVRLCKPMNGSPAGPSVHGILQARILEWVAISSYSVSIQCSFSMGKLPSKLNCLSLTVWMRERLKEKDTIQQPSEAGYHGAKTPDTFQNNSRLSSSLELLLMAMWCS